MPLPAVHRRFVLGIDKTHKPIASVAALTAQPLAALPPYGCGVPLAGSERLWQLQVSRHFRRAYRLSSLSLRGGRRPTWQSRSTRLHRGKATGEIATAFPRLPRRFAPRNDTSGRRSNGNGAAHRIGGTTAASRTGGACPSRRRTGVRDRLSLKWQTPKVCHCEEAKGRRGNLAVPGCIVGKLPAKSQLPSRDCHVASLLAMTRQAGTVVHQRPPAV